MLCFETCLLTFSYHSVTYLKGTIHKHNVNRLHLGRVTYTLNLTNSLIALCRMHDAPARRRRWGKVRNIPSIQAFPLACSTSFYVCSLTLHRLLSLRFRGILLTSSFSSACVSRKNCCIGRTVSIEKKKPWSGEKKLPAETVLPGETLEERPNEERRADSVGPGLK